MKERVAGARGQSADRNYRRPYERGQLTRVVLEGVEGAESSEKRRLAGGISGFWWPLGMDLGVSGGNGGSGFGTTIATVPSVQDRAAK